MVLAGGATAPQIPCRSSLVAEDADPAAEEDEEEISARPGTPPERGFSVGRRIYGSVRGST
ncbi:MAG TPA: hypothetical protein PKJ51_07835 [Methanothrix sp.]|nr:hypothetical protein [Methanothrix sp.]HNT72746.1 hypothetical protein [Methanothrix sp.]